MQSREHAHAHTHARTHTRTRMHTHTHARELHLPNRNSPKFPDPIFFPTLKLAPSIIIPEEDFDLF